MWKLFFSNSLWNWIFLLNNSQLFEILCDIYIYILCCIIVLQWRGERRNKDKLEMFVIHVNEGKISFFFIWYFTRNGIIVIPEFCNCKQSIRYTNYIFLINFQNYLEYFVINSHSSTSIFVLYASYRAMKMKFVGKWIVK